MAYLELPVDHAKDHFDHLEFLRALQWVLEDLVVLVVLEDLVVHFVD